MDKQHIYLFSGLGADERVFVNLDLSLYETTHIQWLTPKPEEEISGYAKRICTQIKHEHPVLIGLSFGGMLAIEVAKHIQIKKLILLASAKTYKEIPFYYRWPGRAGILHLLPISLLKWPNWVMYYLFGAHTREERILLGSILKDTDPVFLKWALTKIVTWTNLHIPPDTVHLHGTKDKILPIKYIACEYQIENGGHLMPHNKQKEISNLLHQLI